MGIRAKHYITLRDDEGKAIQFVKGDIIDILDSKEEKRLVESGAAEYVAVLEGNRMIELDNLPEEEEERTTEVDGEGEDDSNGTDADQIEAPAGNLDIDFNPEEYVQAAAPSTKKKK